MSIEVEPGNGVDVDTERLWGFIEQGRSSQQDVLLKPGPYRVDNTLIVDGVFLHGPLPHGTARTDVNSGFPEILPRISAGPSFQPVIQLRNNGKLENILIEWREWPENLRSVGVMCAQQFSIKSVKIVGATTGIQTGSDFFRGSENSSRFEIEDVFILYSYERAMSMRACLEWATVRDVLIKCSPVAIDLFDGASDITFQNVNMLGADDPWRPNHPPRQAIDIKSGPADLTHFCSVSFIDCSFDDYVNVLRITGREIGNGYNRVAITGGWALVHSDGVIFSSSGAALQLSRVRWKGNSGQSIRFFPPSINQTRLSIDAVSQFEWPR